VKVRFPLGIEVRPGKTSRPELPAPPVVAPGVYAVRGVLDARPEIVGY
jgi:hypothetical protein